jgi:glycosyltransferase involved in cell wall biosynthesis
MRPLTLVNCVSHYSRRQYPVDAPMTVIPNGVALDRFHPSERKEDFVLALGRVCPEKGFHLALDAARLARLPLRIAGSVPPFPEHQRYFEEEIQPRLDADRQFLGPLSLAERSDMLARARCVVVPSLVNETCSLVALEALASGTPVIAFPFGALPENVEHRKTGFLVEDVHQMAQAMHEVGRAIDPRECRAVARRRFSSDRMTSQYIELYDMIAGIKKLDTVWTELIEQPSSMTSAA